jgi:hypothetical protein
MVELYLHSPLHLYGLSTGITFSLLYGGTSVVSRRKNSQYLNKFFELLILVSSELFVLHVKCALRVAGIGYLCLEQWFSNFIGSRRTVKHKNFLAHFVYKIKNILIYFKL